MPLRLWLDGLMAFKFNLQLMLTVTVTVAVTPTVQGVNLRGHCCLGDRPGNGPEPHTTPAANAVGQRRRC